MTSDEYQLLSNIVVPNNISDIDNNSTLSFLELLALLKDNKSLDALYNKLQSYNFSLDRTNFRAESVVEYLSIQIDSIEKFDKLIYFLLYNDELDSFDRYMPY